MFSKTFIQHLSTELNKSEYEIEKAIKTFGVKKPPQQGTLDSFIKYSSQENSISTEEPTNVENIETVESNFPEENLKKSEETIKKLEPKKLEPKKKNTKRECRPCERFPARSDKPCGKNAFRHLEIEGEEKWFCGTEKSGCYKCMLTQKEKVIKTSNVNKQTAPKPKKPQKNLTQKQIRDLSNNATETLVNKITKAKTIKPKKKKIGDEIIYVDELTGICFDPKNSEAYAVLKDEKILDLNDESIRWLEANNLNFRVKEDKNHLEDEIFSSEENEVSIGLSSESE